MGFLSNLERFDARLRNQRQQYQIAPDEVEQIESLITQGDFKGLIKKRVPVTVNENLSECYALELIGACIAGAGNRSSQIRCIFNDLRQIQQRVEAQPERKSTVDLTHLKEGLQQAINDITDADNLLETLKGLLDRYETADPVKDEIELSLALGLSKIRYGSDKLRGIAIPFFERSIQAVAKGPTLQKFQSFVKATEVTYAYFYPLASKEESSLRKGGERYKL